MSKANVYQDFIAISRYARYNDVEQRREGWAESVKRYFDFMQEHLEENCSYKLKKSLRAELESAVLSREVMPSMRALATAGPALDRCNVAAFNCAYLPIESLRSFDELFYILLCGTGVGYSVERQYIKSLPQISEHFEKTNTIIKVADSKSGWARALKELIALLCQGQIPDWDVSLVRPAGARLKTFGGRASGPGPLVELFKYTVDAFRGAAGRHFNPLEAHDLCCKVAATVVVGGVRRSAMISLSNLSDTRMRDAKSGDWGTRFPDRAYANNSVVYTEKPDMGIFMEEWKALHDSHSGERGIFYRGAADKQVAKNGRREGGHEWGTNPCSEIILRPYQFCNLSSVVVRSTDTLESLKAKVRIATILGTFQSTLTTFKYLRKVWSNNTAEERLLGVSLSGICDHAWAKWPSSKTAEWLEELKGTAVATNKKLADNLDIPQSTAITCVKPEGTVSQLVNSGSGIHARYSEYYIRRVRGDKKDPLTDFLKLVGVPVEDDAFKPDETSVFSFPVKGSKGGLTRHDLDAITQLELWKTFQLHWCEHKPSCTVYVKDDEWLKVGAWCYENFEILSGVSFLPFDGGGYTQAPYEEITQDEYKALAADMPDNIDWEKLSDLEGNEDNTGASSEFACTGDSCEIVDIGQ